MFSFNSPYGHPFNPVEDRYFTEPSRAGRLTGELKKAANKSYCDFSDEDNLSMILSLVSSGRNYTLNAFGNSLSMNGIDYSLFKDDHERQIKRLSKLPKKKKNRYFLSSDDLYLEAVKKSFSGKKNIFDFEMIVSPVEEYSKKVFKINDFRSRDEAFPVLEKYLNKIKIESDYLSKIAFMSKVSAGFISSQLSTSFFSMLIDSCYSDLENNRNVLPAISAMWSISRLYSNPDIFYLFYHCFKEKFKIEELPFLKFSVLNFVDSVILEDGFLESYYAKIINGTIKHYLDTKGDVDAHIAISMLFENKGAFPDRLKNNIKVLKEINEMLMESLDYAMFFDKDKHEQFLKELKGVELPDGMSMDINQVESLRKEIKLKIGNIISDIEATKGDPTVEIDEIHSRLKEIDRDSIVFAKDPLTNIEKLKILAEEKALKENKLKLLLSENSKEADRILSRFKEVFDFYQSEIYRRVSDKSEIKSISEMLDMSLAETELLNEELKSKEKECLLLKEKNNELKRNISSCSGNNLTYNYELADLILKINSGKASVPEVILAVSELNRDTVALRSGLIESMESNFTKTEHLFKKLLLLTSKKFLKTYNEDGSEACFSLFTKTELSFQETKATQNKHSRKFEIAGKEYNCKAHLKIGADNTEQNMLRIYFAVDKEKIVIGEVTKHLPIAKKI